MRALRLQIMCGLKGEYRYLIEGDHPFQRTDWAIPEEEVCISSFSSCLLRG
jgi:hypothetical protein